MGHPGNLLSVLEYSQLIKNSTHKNVIQFLNWGPQTKHPQTLSIRGSTEKDAVSAAHSHHKALAIIPCTSGEELLG